MRSIADYYGADSSAYDLMSRDRDFDRQVGELLDGVAADTHRVLELFAGPAYHGNAARRRGCEVVTCIDASEHMRDIACAQGLIAPSDYQVGSLPDALASLPPERRYDAMLCLRYSAGYLSPSALEILLAALHPRLAEGGALYFELHRIDLLSGDLADLSIRERRVAISEDAELRCVWPDGPLRWARRDWVASMTVKLEWIERGKVSRTEIYESSEHIHTIGSLERAARRHGYRVSVLTDELASFDGCEVVALMAG